MVHYSNRFYELQDLVCSGKATEDETREYEKLNDLYLGFDRY